MGHGKGGPSGERNGRAGQRRGSGGTVNSKDI